MTRHYQADPDDVAYYTGQVLKRLRGNLEQCVQRWYEEAYDTFFNKISTGYAETFDYEQATRDALEQAKQSV
jgi:hypothetical protein